MGRCAAFGFVMAATLATAGESAAQTTATSLDELVRARVLGVGDGVYITEVNGRRLKGDVRSVSSTALEVTDGRNAWRFAETEMLNVKRQDALRNGALVGLAVGVGIAGAACKLGGGGCVYGVIRYGYPAIAIGAFLGLMVDAAWHRTVLDLSGSSRVVLSPVISDQAIAARVAAAW